MQIVDREVWKNNIRGKAYVLKEDPLGLSAQRVLEGVPSGQEVVLSSEDRRANELAAARPEANPFRNGTFIPVQLIESAQDYENISSDPNVMQESEIKEILELATTKFKSRIAGISSFHIIQGMIDMAEKEEVDITTAKLKALQARYDELKPEVDLELGDQTVAELPAVYLSQASG